jgi:hypothetical protein
MPATISILDALESRRTKTFNEYSDRVGDVSSGGKVDLHVSWLEKALDGIYAFTLQTSRSEMTAREVCELWKKTVEICDFFILHVRMLAQRSQCSANFDRLLEIRFAAHNKSAFHGGFE